MSTDSQCGSTPPRLERKHEQQQQSSEANKKKVTTPDTCHSPSLRVPTTADRLVRSVYTSACLSADFDVRVQSQAVLDAFIPGRTQRLSHKGIPLDNQHGMRDDVIAHYITRGGRIPVLIAAGLKLPPFEVDYSEVFMLEVLANLQRGVRAVYPKGLHIVMRLEDLTMLEVYPETSTSAGTTERHLQHFTAYAKKLRQLVAALGMDAFLTIRCETELMPDHKQYHSEVAAAAKLFQTYFAASESPHDGTPAGLEAGLKKQEQALAALRSGGWLGEVTPECRTYYRTCYAKRYPSLTAQERDRLVCTYLACTMARRKLRGGGLHGDPECSDQNGGPRLELSFVEPAPGGEVVETRRVWCRSQLGMGLRAPFWRCVAYCQQRPQRQEVAHHVSPDGRDAQYHDWTQPLALVNVYEDSKRAEQLMGEETKAVLTVQMSPSLPPVQLPLYVLPCRKPATPQVEKPAIPTGRVE